MKHLLTLALFAFGLNALAQFPNLPYNPDENGDGLIGVVDLQGLLANYGNEFAGAVVSEDGESAVVYMEQMGYFECEYSCEQLPGFWQIAETKELAPVLDVLNAGSCCTTTWLSIDGINRENFGAGMWPIYEGSPSINQRGIVQSKPGYSRRCYCAAKQLRKVEYTFCNGAWESMLECAEENTSEGWYPLGDISPEPTSGHFVQAFWRWAE